MQESPLPARIGDSFNRQGLMRTLGARLVDISRGRVVVEVPFAETVTQQNGYFHAAVSTAIADTAGGYAALTTMEADDDVLRWSSRSTCCGRRWGSGSRPKRSC
jgi:acyl-coenzyme A thioesterase PaaI-like protein